MQRPSERWRPLPWGWLCRFSTAGQGLGGSYVHLDPGKDSRPNATALERDHSHLSSNLKEADGVEGMRVLSLTTGPCSDLTSGQPARLSSPGSD